MFQYIAVEGGGLKRQLRCPWTCLTKAYLPWKYFFLWMDPFNITIYFRVHRMSVGVADACYYCLVLLVTAGSLFQVRYLKLLQQIAYTSYTASTDTCVQQLSPVCLGSLFVYWRCNKLEACQVLLSVFCLKKYQFWFLVILRTASVCQCVCHKSCNCR